MERIIGNLSQMSPTKRAVTLVGIVLLVYAATAPLDVVGVPRVGPMLRGVAGASAAVLAFRATSPEWRERNDPRAKWPLPGRRWGLVAILLVWLSFVVFAGKSFPGAVTETANATVILILCALALRGPTDPVPDTEPVATWEWHNPLKTLRGENADSTDNDTSEPPPRLTRRLFRTSPEPVEKTAGSQVDEIVALSAEDPEEAASQVAEDAELAAALTAQYPELSEALKVMWRSSIDVDATDTEADFYEDTAADPVDDELDGLDTDEDYLEEVVEEERQGA